MTKTRKCLCRILLTMWLALALVAVGEGLAQDARAPAVPAADANAKPAPKDEPYSVLGIIIEGGWLMIPIGICSVIALALTIERFISLRRTKVIPPDFIVGLKNVFGGKSEEIGSAVQYCERSPSPISYIFKAGIRRLPQGQEMVEKAVEDAGAREDHKMRRSLKPLSVIATISPLLGLLGTVFGMIIAFQATYRGGIGKGEALARGIYRALVTTAGGLTLAIPVLIIYQVLVSRVDNLVDDMDDQAIEFLEYAVYEEKGGKKTAT